MEEDKNKAAVTTPESSDPGYTHEDISTVDITDIAAGKTAPEPEKTEDKPVVPAFDLEAEKKKWKEEAKAETLAELKAQREAERQHEATKAKDPPTNLTKKQQAEATYIKFQEDFFKEYERNPEWYEVAAFTEERKAKQEQEAKEQAEKQQLDEQKNQEEKMKAERELIQKRVDRELNVLYKTNRLPTIKDPTNPSDPGVIEKMAFATMWRQVNQKLVAAGEPECVSAVEIYEDYYKNNRPNMQPAGYNAPVTGPSGGSSAPTSEQGYSYQDLKKPWSWLAGQR